MNPCDLSSYQNTDPPSFPRKINKESLRKWLLISRYLIPFQPTFEDSMDLIAKLPVIAAIIYNNLYRDGATPASIDLNKDWSYNYTEMIGYKDPMFTELMRLYLTIHR